MRTPCRECCTRHTACHAECEMYKAWRAKYDAMKAERDKQTEADRNYRSFLINSASRQKNRKRLRGSK